MEESRHQIKTRMLKNAARAWGYPEAEAENYFDPLVAMLLASCATELEKISGEIHASRARVLERLVQLLSPDTLTGALPAHGIACALPVENQAKLGPDTQLWTQRKLSLPAEAGSAAAKELFFTPSAPCRLNRASIRFMATGNMLYSINHNISKELIARAQAENELPPSTLWLAIDEPGVDLHQSQFYFDLRNEANKTLFFHQLPKATWMLDGDPIEHREGYGQTEISGENLCLEEIVNRNTNTVGRMMRHVNAYYKTSFITLIDDRGITAGKNTAVELPAIIAEVFSGKEIQALQKQPLRWIAVRFPETISNKLLNDVVCVMNCFPVMNSRLHDISYRLQETINIIPLQTDDIFLDLAEVSDDEGQIVSTGAPGDGGEHTAVLSMRNGGVGRFDERDAASVVDHILHLLRDDSAAFSVLGNDFMNTEMKQLQQIINKLEQQLSSSQVPRAAVPYLVVRNRQKRAWNTLFIRYWSTNGTEGNNIKPGTALQLYKGGYLDSNGAVLVSATQGGRNKLTPTETVLAYKTALLSKDRVITKEDVKAFCRYQLGERAKNIQVQKGVMIHPDQQQGFQKTIDVIISIRKKIYHEMEETGELRFWADNLKLLLEEKSASFMPYRVYLNAAI